MELFDPQYTTGQMSGELFGFDFVGTFVSIFGPFCMIVISIVGFFIVNASLFKNSLNGLYATFPKWFDAVDDEKKTKLTINHIKSINVSEVDILGLPLKILIRLTPNVKAMADIAEGVQDPKTYFMKALPIAVVQIFIGVFIFYGYTAAIGDKAAQFGTELIDVVLLNVEPKEWVNNLPGEWGRPNMATEGSFQDFDKVVNASSKAVYTSAVSVIDDISAENKNNLALQIEKWVEQCLEPNAEYTNSEAYDYKVNARVELTSPDLSRVNGEDKPPNYQRAFAIPLSDFQTGTVVELGDRHVRFDIIFKEIAKKEVSLTNLDNVLTVPNSMAKLNGNKELTIDIGSYDVSNHLVVLTNASAKIGETSVKIAMATGSNKLIITPATKSGTIPADYKSINTIAGVQYKAGTSKHNVKSITIGGTGKEAEFVPGNKDINPWKPGEAPTPKNPEGEGTTSPSSGGKGDVGI